MFGYLKGSGINEKKEETTIEDPSTFNLNMGPNKTNATWRR
jgi:hypothetical protein